MYVEFGSMVIHDFKAFKGRHGLAFNEPGVIFVVGENKVTKRLYANGAAKSTIWDALTWCLYGKTPRGLRTTDVKPWSGGKPYVNVLITVDEREYLCERATSPKNLFTVNGEERADISDILPISFELFINTILLPQGKELFFDQSPKDKMALVSEARGLERWDSRSVAAAKTADRLDQEVSDLQNEERVQAGKIVELDRSLEDARAESRAWNDAAQARVQVSKTALVAFQKEFKRKDDELGTAVLAEDGALLEFRACEQCQADLGRDGLTIMGKVQTLRSQIETLNNTIDDADEEIANLAAAKRCPTCGQPVKATNVAEHKAHLEQESAEAVVKLKARKKELNAAVREGEAIHDQLGQSVEASKRFRQKANEASDIITRLRPEVATLKRQIEEAQKVKEEVNPHFDTIRRLAERRTGLVADLATIKADVASAQAEAERSRYWVKAFKDIKLQLIEELLQEFELVVNSMIEEVGLDDWEIRCDIEKETKSGSVQRLINIQINSPESKGFVKWESWSGGESQRLKLIGSLTLSDVLLAQVGVETNLEILDEPAVYWSSEGIQELCGVLADRARERNKTIFFIEHNTVESTHFSEVLRVVKDKKGAYIE